MTVKILFLAANPPDTNRLMLDEEFHEVEDRIRRADLRDLFELSAHFATRVDELPGLLLRHRPTIVHFSGHGSRASQIMMDGDSGGSHAVSAQTLGNLFSLMKDNVRCVLLNSCHSEPQAEAIAEHIACVVGMSRQVPDKAAIIFAATFYEMLGYGRSIRFAFEIACWMLGAQGVGEEKTPRLICRNDDADRIVLASRDVIDPPELVAELTRTLIQGEEDERLEAAQELTNVVRKSLTAILVERSISDPSPQVRYWLNRALGKIGTPATIEILRENLADPDELAALGAEDALAELKP